MLAVFIFKSLLLFFKQVRTVCLVCMSDILKWLYYHLQRWSFPCLANPNGFMFKELLVLEGGGGRRGGEEENGLWPRNLKYRERKAVL